MIFWAENAEVASCFNLLFKQSFGHLEVEALLKNSNHGLSRILRLSARKGHARDKKSTLPQNLLSSFRLASDSSFPSCQDNITFCKCELLGTSHSQQRGILLPENCRWSHEWLLATGASVQMTRYDGIGGIPAEELYI